MRDSDGVPDATEVLTKIISDCAVKGMQPPFIAVVFDRNGTVMALRISESNTEFLAEHYEGPGFETPARVVVLDQNHDEIQGWIDPEGEPHSD